MSKRKKSEIMIEELKRVKDEHTVEEEQIEVIRELRDLRPAHYLFKIKNFSLLQSNTKLLNYESTDFEVAGYQWKLSLYPRGVLKNNEYISLYLVLSDSNKFTLHQEVNTYFKLFVYNQVQDKYLTVQDAKWRLRRFRGMKTEWGFDQLVLLSVFNDPSNGYLIDDCCIFGAEVFVVEPISKGECASVVKYDCNNTYTWNIQNFAELKHKGTCKSEVFSIGGYKWILSLYPNGKGEAKDKSLSLFLELEKPHNLGRKLSVDFVMRVKDQLHGNHHDWPSDFSEFCQFHDQLTDNKWSWGYLDFIPLSKLNDASKGYLINGAIVLEVQISFIAKVEEFS